MMKAAGINIIFSIPGLKVHAKVALVLRRDKEGRKLTSYAYISTGNFNEKTATLYADSGLFTCNPVIVNDLHNLFRTLQGKENPVICEELTISTNTLKKHILNIYRKLGIRNRVQLFKMIREHDEAE